MKALQGANFLRGIPAQEFAAQSAMLVNEINAAHPFIDGNGRTQRVWLQNIALQAGHVLGIRSSDREMWNDASRIGFERADHRLMASLIQANLRPIAAERSPERTSSRSRSDQGSPER